MPRKLTPLVFITVLFLFSFNSAALKARFQNAQEQYFIFSNGADTFRTTLSSGATQRILNGSGVWKFTPDGQALVIQYGSAFTVVPLAGGASRNIGQNVAGSANFAINSDGSYVVYMANGSELYSVPLGGGQSIPLSKSGSTVYAYDITPDGKTVIYLADMQRRQSLFAVPIAGGTPTALTDRSIASFNPAGSAGSSPFEISSDSSHVVFAGIKRDTERWGIFSVLITDGTLTQINTEDVLSEQGYIGSACCVDVVNFGLTLDGLSVTYKNANGALYEASVLGDKAPSPETQTILAVMPDHQKMLVSDGAATYSVMDSASGTSTHLDLPNGSEPQLTPDGQYVINYSETGVYRTSTADGKSQKISPDYVKLVLSSTSPNNKSLEFAISPDSQQVVYFATDIDGFELLSTPIMGGETQMLNEVPGTTNSIFAPLLWISADSSKVVFMLDQEEYGQRDLYLVPISGGKNIHLTKDRLLYHAGYDFRAEMAPPTLGSSSAPSAAVTDGSGDSSNLATPSEQPTTSSQLVVCPASPPTRLSVGGHGKVTPGEANNLRDEPSGTSVAKMPPGSEFDVIEGPQCGKTGLTFWKVQYGDLVGWTAEGKGSDYWLEPVEDGRG